MHNSPPTWITWCSMQKKSSSMCVQSMCQRARKKSHKLTTWELKKIVFMIMFYVCINFMLQSYWCVYDRKNCTSRDKTVKLTLFFLPRDGKRERRDRGRMGWEMWKRFIDLSFIAIFFCFALVVVVVISLACSHLYIHSRNVSYF